MKLPPGATGFGAYAHRSEDDLQALAAVCHHAARRTGGTVAELIPLGATPNFHTATITYPDDSIAVLRHGLLSWLALAKPTLPGQAPHDWLDRTDLAEAIGEVSDLRILTRAELSRPLTDADLADLGAAEIEQVAYWRPTTVGDVLFNLWD
ncbi:hypothetical protein [Catellatospora citrea]|uniref:Uncharacterized protein n=1 Tax=Catellatospora citrea TaxID=53366 RepID=A0A8J3KT79_9ACTN|nr:hypothetical protein [Catellatospora citrea]RKE12318.1 hypothetical protein C8E86_7256 [Catellatospora citrea]GIG00825.1 hypothetical protein Cci01nite_59180 [Catellatospora citrea]